MAPTKNARGVSKQSVTASVIVNVLPLTRKGSTRRLAPTLQDQNVEPIQTRGKRKAEYSPVKHEKVKRSALGNLTNNSKMMTTTTNTHHPEDDVNHLITKKDNHQFGTEFLKHLHNFEFEEADSQAKNKITTRAAAKNMNNSKILEERSNKLLNMTASLSSQISTTANLSTINVKAKNMAMVPPVPPAPVTSTAPMAMKASHKPVRRISNEFNKTEESLYMSALEDISSCESVRLSGNFETAKRKSTLLHKDKKTENKPISIINNDNTLEHVSSPPEDVNDFDKANWNDPFQVSHYAMDIFNYLKSRESDFPITDYMGKQVHLSKWMRSLLVDWMVEVQETFELNHETLYLAVKIVDLFLCRVVINKDKLQLLGASALFIACKFDERIPPLIEDFLYICDGAYDHDELIQMEMITLRTIDYDLGIPLSYRFLRRYARCAKVPMPTLTLARYILELSLMDYATISFSDSQLASAALFIALRLHGANRAWTSTLEYYSGYKVVDFAEIVPVLNAGMHRKPKGTIKTIRSKYSHKIFHEVAKVTLMSTEQLFENNFDTNTSINLDCTKIP